MDHYDAAPSHFQEYCQSFQSYSIMTPSPASSPLSEVSRYKLRLDFHIHSGFSQTRRERTSLSPHSLKFCRSKPSNNELCEEHCCTQHLPFFPYTKLAFSGIFSVLHAKGLLKHIRIYSRITYYRDLGSKISEYSKII